jgi:uncharacterized protein DUF3810
VDAGAFPSDRPLRLVRRAIVVVPCGLGMLGAWIAAQNSDVAEAYATRVWPLFSRPLAAVSGVFPFGVGELLVWAAVLAILLWIVWTIVAVARGRRRLGNAIACGLLGAAEGLGVVGLLFVFLWGMNYARPEVPERLHWPAVATTESPADELARVGALLVDAANRERAASGTLTWSEVDREVDSGYERLANRLGLPDRFAASRGPAKRPLGSPLMSWFGVSGIYFPFTGEANVNRQVPASEQPFVLGHEKAHQRGVAAEDEASFFGFLACAAARDPWVRYSGVLFAQRQILNELARFEPEQTRDLVAKRSPEVQRDVDDSNAFWKRHRGFFSDVGRAVNDAYLHLNGVAEGVDSYDRSARLLVLFARTNGGSCVLGP